MAGESLPNLSKEPIRHGREQQDHPAGVAGIDHGSLDRDCPRRGAADAGTGSTAGTGGGRRGARVLERRGRGVPHHASSGVLVSQKSANVLSKFPNVMTPAVNSELHDIYHAETRAAAQSVIALFAEKYGAKYPATVHCL